MIRSESMIVFKRWAIVNTVQSLNLSRIVSWINESVLWEKIRWKSDIRSIAFHERTEKEIKRLVKKSSSYFFFMPWELSIRISWKVENMEEETTQEKELDDYFWSTLAVASSRTRIRLRLRMARARHTNCLWPTERLVPPSVITESNPPVSSDIDSFRLTYIRYQI